MGSTLGSLLIFVGSIVAGIMLLIFLAVPLFKGIGSLIGFIFKGIGWLIMHVFEFLIGMCKDTIRLAGTFIAMAVLMPMVPLSVIFGRWSAAGHFAQSVKRECQVGTACIYRVLLKRPLKLLLLDGLLEGLEQRVPEALEAAPTADSPGRRTGRFDGYEIVGSLRSGGSGAKLYVARPTDAKRARTPHLPERVVIKSFAITDGSSLPQIVRESRALECAKQVGHVLDHGMDEHRFFYVMPYIPGEHLGIITRQLHGESDGAGLEADQLACVMGYLRDLLATLSGYHKGGLWHKDVKPENVIVHDGRAHLVDLGLVTPLRSAMTLTTHGTEYFRDPEMVRQALRGVKVHQVDGAKFDIYAVGAVLYFMIENEFPAHGALSAFSKRSPEALRWIVRRAMADYNKRYETADVMLADLAYVSRAADAFAVRLSELPSMSGAPGIPDVLGIRNESVPVIEILSPALAQSQAVLQPQVVAAARTPIPPSPAAPSTASRPSADQSTKSRPKLRVTNWWTGEYAVESPSVPDMASASGDLRAQSRLLRQHGRALAQDAMSIAMNTSMRTARRAAREQIRAARGRAAEIRSRVRNARHKAVAERQPSPALVGATLVVFLVGGLAVFGVFGSSRRHAESAVQTAAVSRADFAPLADGLRAWLTQSAGSGSAGSVLVMDGLDLHDYNSERTRAIHEAVASQVGGAGVKSGSGIAARVRPYVTRMKTGREKVIGALDRILKDAGCSALVVFTGERDQPFLVYPTAAAAAVSTFTVPTASRKLIVINDHPAAANPQVQALIDDELKVYTRRGYVAVDAGTELEAELRSLLARRQIDPSGPSDRELRQRLDLRGLDGLLHIEAAPAGGDGGGAGGPDRILATLIESLPAPAESPDDPDQPPAAGSAPSQGSVSKGN